jgi:hypothetical protein
MIAPHGRPCLGSGSGLTHLHYGTRGKSRYIQAEEPYQSFIEPLYYERR